MQIGEVIRKNRKNRNLTQEEMASRLGVTAPAVNKWENGNSYPDILLLAPIARLLGITPDTLLSFHEELTEEEINQFISEADQKLKNEAFEEAFQWARAKLEEYPNCAPLIYRTALVFDAWRLAKALPVPENFEEFIYDCYVQVLENGEEDLRNSAADSLFGYYIRKGQYEKAETYLSYFSKQDPERKRKQAMIYSKTGRISEAYQAYEELLFSGYQSISAQLYGIYTLAMEEGNQEKAHALVEKQKSLANVFEMGEYQGLSCALDLATAERDADAVIEIMEKMLASVESMFVWRESALYEHMAFQMPQKDFLKEIKKNLKNHFRDEQIYGFLKTDKRWQELVKEVKEL